MHAWVCTRLYVSISAFLYACVFPASEALNVVRLCARACVSV